jgi:hypothetical protein
VAGKIQKSLLQDLGKEEDMQRRLEILIFLQELLVTIHAILVFYG